MENKQIRRANLLKLLERHGTLVQLAEKTHTVPAHLSQVKNGTRAIGDEVARRIEAHLHLGNGWMDVLHDVPAELPEDERLLLDHYRRAPRDWRDWLLTAAAFPRDRQMAYMTIAASSDAGRLVVHEPSTRYGGETPSTATRKTRRR